MKDHAPRNPGELRRQAEERLREMQSGQKSEIGGQRSAEDPARLLHELQVHQIELEMQNEELRRAQTEIEAGRARYFDLYDLAPSGYFTLSEQGLILEINLTAATLLGTARGALVQRPLSHFIIKDDQDIYYLHRKNLFETGKPQDCELRLVRPDGMNFWAHLTATAAHAEDGAPVCRVAMIDITERKRTEKALFDMAERYRLANKASNDVVWDWDIVNDAQRWNESGAAVFGWMDIVNAPQPAAWWVERVHPEDQPRVDEAFFAAVCNPAVDRWHDEYRFRKADGAYACVVDRGHILRDADGRAVRVIGAMLDITERKRAEEAQKETSMRLQESVRAANVGLWDWDLTTNRVHYSHEWKRQIGYEDAEIGDAFGEWESRVHPEDLAPTLEKVRVAIAGASRRYQADFRFRHKDGSYRWIVAQCSVLRDDTGKAVRVIGSHLDFTEYKRAEEALRESEERFSTAFNTSPFAITITRAKDGKLIEVNNAFMTMTGVSREDALSNTSLGLGLWVNMEDRDQVVHDLRAGRSVVGHEYPFRTKGEKTFMGSFSARAIVLGGEPCVLSCIEDITERKRAEEAHERLQAQLLQAQKLESVGRLAGGVAHDFNNFLTGIMGYAEMCREKVGSVHPISEWLDEITNGAKRSTDLTRQLLAFARKQTILPQVLELNDAVSGMLKLLRRLIGEDIALAWMPGTDVWPVKVDPGQIDQILANLCVNARDAIGGVGRITIETGNTVIDRECCEEDAEAAYGEYAVLTVSDDGCGMDRETLAHIFEPFFTTKELGQGTGLGLATVYGIARQNGGFINVHSEQGKGATFRVCIPRCKDEAGAVAVPMISGLSPCGTETILLVEDERSVCVTTARFLEAQGYSVLAAVDPLDALRLVERHSGPIHLLITDVVMPCMNGRELAVKLTEKYASLKCLFISGYTANVIAHRGILEEGVHFLSKPFTRDVIARKVYDVLKGE